MIPDKFIHPNPKTFDQPSSRRQYFSLPFGIISYITQNPISPNGLVNLQKTCKYFFIQNKIIVVNNYVSCLSENLVVMDIVSHKNTYLIRFKYWLVNGFEICDKYPSKLIAKNIYRCNLRNLMILDQKLTMAEFDFLLNGGNITNFIFVDSEIMEDGNNGKILSCDKILSKVSMIESFDFECKNEIFSNKIFENMNALNFNSKFEHFCFYLYNLEISTDVSLLCNFIKKNANANIKSYFRFVFKMDNAEIFRTTLQSAVDNTFTKNELDVYIN